jgi:hypothetical protein
VRWRGGPKTARLPADVEVIGGDLTAPEFLSPAPDFRKATAARWPERAVTMLLTAWAATLGHRAYVSSAVAEVTGNPARTFRAWARDRADLFR